MQRASSEPEPPTDTEMWQTSGCKDGATTFMPDLGGECQFVPPRDTGECASSRFLVEYVWGPTCKSLVRSHQGLRENMGVRRAWRHRRTRKYVIMLGSVCKRLGQC